jgi:putative FmdB family regulatory protein
MPTYDYRCPNGDIFEVFQRMADPDPAGCPVCGAAPVERVLSPVAVHFKGSGFYSTDYGSKSKRDAKEGESSSKDGEPAKNGDKPSDSTKGSDKASTSSAS